MAAINSDESCWFVPPALPEGFSSLLNFRSLQAELRLVSRTWSYLHQAYLNLSLSLSLSLSGRLHISSVQFVSHFCCFTPQLPSTPSAYLFINSLTLFI